MEQVVSATETEIASESKNLINEAIARLCSTISCEKDFYIDHEVHYDAKEAQ